MVFSFRGIRAFQILMAVSCVPLIGGAALMLETSRRGEGWWLALPALLMVVVGLFLFSVALRLPSSFVGLDLHRHTLRIRLSPFLDTTIPFEQISSATVVHRGWGWGLGVRTNFREIALLTGWGDCTQFALAEPIGVWAIPGVWRLRSATLTVSVRDPYLLAAQFEDRAQSPQ
jgi:hypothetical protein